MCLGVPMLVERVEAGVAWAHPAPGTGTTPGARKVDLALVGSCQPGEWLLVFIDTARERIDATRAAEINSALALLDAALRGDEAGAAAEAGFALPSQLDAAALTALTQAGTRRSE
ncbi:MAG: HypC/HybG/HupF family hydrogenase formation chaperone [Polyangiales bacterium]